MWDFDDLEVREEAARVAETRSWALVHKPSSDASPEAKDTFNSGDLEVDRFIWNSDVEIARGVAMFGIGVVALPTLAGIKGLSLASALDYEACFAACPDLPKDALISQLRKCFGELAPAQVVEALGSRKADLEAKIAKLTLRELQKEVAQLFAWKKDVASRLKTFERRAASAFLGLRRDLLAPCPSAKLCHSAAEVAAAIRTAFRRKALELHPDKGGSAERFQVLQDLRRQVLQPLLQELDGSPCLDQAGSTDELEKQEQDDANNDRARQDGSSERAEEDIGVESAFKATPLQSDQNEWTSGPACDRQSLPDLTGEEAARLKDNFAMTRRHMCAGFKQMWQQLRALATEIMDNGEVGLEIEDKVSNEEKLDVVMQRLDSAVNEGTSRRRESHNTAFEAAQQNVRQIVGSIDATVDALSLLPHFEEEEDPENNSDGQGEDDAAPAPPATSLERATLVAQEPPHSCLASHASPAEPNDDSLQDANAFENNAAACAPTQEELSVDASTLAADDLPGDALAEGVERLPGPTVQDLKWIVWNTMWCTANIAMSCVSHGEMKRDKLRAAAGDRLRRDKHRRSLLTRGTIDAEVVKGLIVLANEAGLLAVQASHTTKSSSDEGGEEPQQRIDLSKYIAAAEPMSALLVQGQWPLIMYALQRSAAAVKEMLREFSPNLKRAVANHDQAWQLLTDDLLTNDGEDMEGYTESEATPSGASRQPTGTNGSCSSGGPRSEATSNDMSKTTQPLASLPQSLAQHLKWMLWNAAWGAANIAVGARDSDFAAQVRSSAAENKQRYEKHLEGCKDTGLLSSECLAKLKILAEACGVEVASGSWVADALAKLAAATSAMDSKLADRHLGEGSGPDVDPVRGVIWSLAGAKENRCSNDFSDGLWKKLMLALSYAAECIGHMQLGAGQNSHGFAIARGRWCQFLFDSTWNSALAKPLQASPREANAGLLPALTVTPVPPTSPPPNAFVKHGFWGPVPGLSFEEVETCRKAFHSSMKEIAAAAQSKTQGLRLIDYFDLFRNTHVHLPWVHTLAHHPRIVGLAQKTLKTSSVLLYSSQLCSWPGPGEGQRSGTRHDECTNLSVALGPVDEAVVILLALSKWHEAGGAPGYFHDYGDKGVDGPKTCIALQPGQLSAHKVGVPFLCGINRTKQRLDGIMLLYLSSNVRDLHVETNENEPRDWAVLVSGTDTHGNFRLLRAPSEEDPGKALELRHLRLRRFGKVF